MAKTRISGPSIVPGGFQGPLTGDVTGTLTGNQIMPAAAVPAAGSTAATAAALAYGFSHVTGADATKGVILPAAAAGRICIIKNADAANAVLKVYPATGDGINALTVTTGTLDMAAKTSAILIAIDATTWYSIPLLPS
jgi:hypothetical protein